VVGAVLLALSVALKVGVPFVTSTLEERDAALTVVLHVGVGPVMLTVPAEGLPDEEGVPSVRDVVRVADALGEIVFDVGKE